MKYKEDDRVKVVKIVEDPNVGEEKMKFLKKYIGQIGKITCIEKDRIYPIRVLFEEMGFDNFTEEELSGKDIQTTIE